MRLRKMKCENCGATLELNLDHLQAFCPYCGQKLYIETAQLGRIVAEKEKTKRTVVVEENYTKRQSMAYEHESKEKDKERKDSRFTFLILIAMMLIPLLISITMSNRERSRSDQKTAYLRDLETKIEEAIQNGDYDTALINANKLYADGDAGKSEKAIWDEKREAFIRLIEDKKKNDDINDPNTVFVSTKSSTLEGKNYKEVEEQLRVMGFTNIKTQVSAESPGWFDKADSVEHILIGGKTEFTAEDHFDKDTPIIIYYYQKD